ncbi:hypothetical protein PIROE2DRAFT_67728 [Piromyces sp. E2]|nr:hypothetical protein PIROE2DRAFT_67728 [Piromyces sp. E2]|eukprot:OUM58875.1 hypothetical protein PIROE2DRAFT_67728 [Piromyces sp. E2]
MSHLDEDASIITEGPSIVSVENIVPTVKHTHKGNNTKKKVPQLHKVEVSYSIDEIPEDVDINDEVEEDVFMRPSMMRYVEVEPSPILLHEAQTTRISFISNQSSEPPQNILNQDILNSFSSNASKSSEEDGGDGDEDEDKTAKNEKLESPTTLMSLTSPTSMSNEIIIKNDEASISTSIDYDIKEENDRNSNNSCLEQLLKNNNPSINEEDSPTLNENILSNDPIKNGNNSN